tara:strand:+ start:785 stop:1426 length:642 start_codon:yes stop_codon:yes gene_type:complete
MFSEKKYQVIEKAISYELANFAFNYFLLKRDAVAWSLRNNHISEFTPGFGTWKDRQVPNTYSCYGDMFMETLMMKVLPGMQKHTGLRLIPTYTYTRAYKKGDILKRHKDRPSCEISTTLHLGGDPWSIFIDPTGSNNVIDEYKNIHKPNAPKGNEVQLGIGDMLVYSGCDLEHWREPFEGDVCVQTFLHYNHVDGKFAEKNKFDGRPMLGIPK